MKLILILALLISGSVYAIPYGNNISDSNIICSNPQDNSQFLINTKAGKVWYKKLSSEVEVQAPLFSGVYSSEKYVGEILGEMTYSNDPCYTTLIMRDVKGKPELEAQLYSKANQDAVVKLTLNCDIK